jgi:hypothetical protein
MLKTIMIACCLATSSAAFATEPATPVSMKKLPAKFCHLSSRTKTCAYSQFVTCCFPDQICAVTLDRPRCLPEL